MPMCDWSSDVCSFPIYLAPCRAPLRQAPPHLAHLASSYAGIASPFTIPDVNLSSQFPALISSSSHFLVFTLFPSSPCLLGFPFTAFSSHFPDTTFCSQFHPQHLPPSVSPSLLSPVTVLPHSLLSSYPRPFATAQKSSRGMPSSHLSLHPKAGHHDLCDLCSLAFGPPVWLFSL